MMRPNKPCGTMLSFQKQKEEGKDSLWHGMSSKKYLMNAGHVVGDLLKKDRDGKHLKTTAMVPVVASCKPELDVSLELNANMTSRFHQLIGVSRWAIELGIVDIYPEVSLILQYLANLREGHLEVVYHIYAFLKSHQKLELVFDPIDVVLDETCFEHIPIT